MCGSVNNNNMFSKSELRDFCASKVGADHSDNKLANYDGVKTQLFDFCQAQPQPQLQLSWAEMVLLSQL